MHIQKYHAKLSWTETKKTKSDVTAVTFAMCNEHTNVDLTITSHFAAQTPWLD